MERRIVGIVPPDHARISKWINALALKYGDLLECTVIGKSLLDREIFALRIGNNLSGRRVLYCGGVHGREWITSLLLMVLAEDILEQYAKGGRICEMDVRRLLDASGLVIIPALNPDGIDISVNSAADPGLKNLLSAELLEKCGNTAFCRRWKSNARGVDLNRNFNAGWDDMRLAALERGITGPSSEGWTGKYPESEPETRAVVNLCESMRFRHMIAFHSQGEVIYWNYREFTPPRAHIMARILAMSSGYTLSEPDRLAGAAGLKDWFMEKYGAPAFTVEVGCGECPLPLSGFRFMYHRLREMLVLGIAM